MADDPTTSSSTTNHLYDNPDLDPLRRFKSWSIDNATGGRAVSEQPSSRASVGLDGLTKTAADRDQNQKTHRWSRQANHVRFVGGNCKIQIAFREIFPSPAGRR